jgi:hypothetical protein
MRVSEALDWQGERRNAESSRESRNALVVKGL